MKNLLLICILLSKIVFSQGNNGSITGAITDHTTGKGIPFANIVVLSTQTGATTNENGYYSIKNLNPGTYQVKVSAVGYSTLTKTDISVSNSKPTQIDFSLKEETLKLSNVVITADYFSKDNIEPTSVRSFSYEEIRRAPGGFEDVVRALSIVPGVAQADEGRNDLVVRGGAPSENLYLLDGFEIPNINHFGTQGATGGPLSFINLDFVKEVTFSTGGFPVLYGDKLSSALRINLRDGRNDRFGGKVTIAATQFGLNLEGPISNNSSFLFSARRSYLDFIFKAAGFGFVPEYYDFIAKYDYNFSQKSTFSIFAISAIDNVRYFNSTNDQRFSNSRVLGSDQLQYTAGMSYRYLLPQGFIKVYLSRNSVAYNSQQNDSLLQPIFKNKSLETEDKLKVEWTHRFAAAFEASLGADAKYIHFDSDAKIRSFPTSFNDTLLINSLMVNDNYLKYSTYFNLTFQPLPRFSTNAGMRVDYFNAIKEKFTVSPRVSTSYDLSDLLSLSGSAGIYHQTPSYIWLAAGNKSLNPVTVTQFVLGTEYRFRSDAQIKVELYRKNYADYPVSVLRPYLTLANTGSGFGGSEDNFSSFGFEQLTSGGSGYSQGIELSAQKKLSEIPCYGLISITYGKTKFTALDKIERSGSYDQNLIFNLSGGYQFNKSLEASMKFRFASGRPYTPFDNNGKQLPANFNSSRLEAAHSLDLRVDKRWFYERYTLITYLDLQNIYNHKNISGIRWNSRENKVEDAKSIGLLPSIGVSFEF